MRSKFNYFYQKSSGFTLVELIIVMAILGLLATIGLGSFRSSQIKGRDAQRKHDLAQVQRGLEAYYNDKGRYPLAGEMPTSGEWRGTAVAGGEGTLYMKSIPIDPKGANYPYESTDGTYYKIFAHLENQKDKDIKSCAVVIGQMCGTPACNYGVSSGNVDVCE